MRHDTPFSRRSFMAGTAAALATAAVRPLFAQAAAPAAETKKLGFAIMGIGTLATGQILPAFRQTKYCKPVAFVTGHADKNRARATQLGIDPKNIYTYDNYDDIKNNPEIDVVYNVLPNNMHREYTVRAFKAGKHVLCEKPMATNVEDCQAMIDAGKAANKKLMIAYRMQYEPLTQAAIKAARDPATVGQIKEITAEAGFNMGATSTPANTWRLNKKMAGGGALMDMGIYALQACRYLSGEEPLALTAIAYQPPNSTIFSEVEETMNVALQFPSGFTASILTTYGFGCNRARVYGTRGQVELDPLQNYNNNHLYVSRGGRGGGRQEVTVPPVDHFANEMDQMCLAIMNDKQPLTPGEEGLRDVKIMMACFESVRTGKTVKLT